MPDDRVPTYKKIQTRFKNYRKQMRDIWESYNLVNFYLPLLHAQIKTEEITTLEVPLLLNPGIKRYSKQDTFGAIDHLIKKANPRRTLIDAVSCFEDFLGQLTYFVYTDYPGKLLADQDDNQPLAQTTKMLKLIIDSSDKNEILSKIVEEKIRSIFYGTPSDFFEKDKAKLEFGDYFKTECRSELLQYQEITARRNVLIHNGGKIDRKYLREVKNSTFVEGQIVPLPTAYLGNSILILEGLSATATSLVLRNIYKIEPRGPLATSLRSFSIRLKKYKPQ